MKQYTIRITDTDQLKEFISDLLSNFISFEVFDKSTMIIVHPYTDEDIEKVEGMLKEYGLSINN